MEPPDQAGGDPPLTWRVCRSRVALQWSRLTRQAETARNVSSVVASNDASMEPPDQAGGDTCEHFKYRYQPELASMEPPDQAGGDPHSHSRRHFGKSMLQWSRLTRQAETCYVPDMMEKSPHWLQWSRLTRQAETRQRWWRHHNRYSASMEPPDQAGGDNRHSGQPARGGTGFNGAA